MSTLESFYKNHPLETPFREIKRNKILKEYSPWVSENTFNEWHYILFYLANETPLCYHDNNIINTSLEYLQKNSSLALQAITSQAKSLDHAIISILQPTSSWNERETPSLDTPDKSAAFESIWHPEYQRYSEHIYNHLIRIHLFILSKIKNRDYLSPVLANRSQLIADNISVILTSGFDSVIRNAISHGGTEYELMSIRYTDSKSEKQITPSEFGKQFDNLVDTCHSLLSSILLFIAESKGYKIPPVTENLPFGARLLLTAGLVSHPGLKIVTMLETHSIKSTRQLNIVCRVNNPSRASHQYDALFVAYISARLYSLYDRILLSIDSGHKIYSLLAFDGRILKKAIEINLPLSDCTGIIQASLLWYDASKIKSWFSTLFSMMMARWPSVSEEIRSNIIKTGIIKPIYRYIISDVENNSTEKEPRILCYAILEESGTINDKILINTIIDMINKLRNHRVQRKDIYGTIGFASSPKIITIRLSSQKRRIRTLKTLSWMNKELVLVAEWSSTIKKSIPFYTKDADFIKGALRIKINPAIEIIK